MNFIIFVLSKFISQLIAENNVIIRERTAFDTEHKTSKFLLEIMTLVLSAIKTDSGTKYSKLIVTQQQWVKRSFIHSDKLLNGDNLQQNFKNTLRQITLPF